eukprot:c15013_g1_i2 orf=207-761(-)
MAMLSMSGRNVFGSCITCSFRGNSKEHGMKTAEFVEVVVEVPKGNMVKRRPDGSMDFILPCPCPFNYGSVKSTHALDGDPLDAIVLGGYLPYGHTGTWRVKGMLKFIDAGIVDNKLVCVQPLQQSKCFSKQTAQQFQASHEDITILDWLTLNFIFSAYSPFKQFINTARGIQGVTSFNGWEFYN